MCIICNICVHVYILIELSHVYYEWNDVKCSDFLAMNHSAKNAVWIKSKIKRQSYSNMENALENSTEFHSCSTNTYQIT